MCVSYSEMVKFRFSLICFLEISFSNLTHNIHLLLLINWFSFYLKVLARYYHLFWKEKDYLTYYIHLCRNILEIIYPYNNLK